MMDAPKRIWINLRGSRWVTEDDAREDHGDVDYLLGSEHDRLMAEKDAEIARLLDAMKDATAHLVGAESAYRKYAKRQKDILPKAEDDPFFTTRVEDFRKAVNRARAALENRDADT